MPRPVLMTQASAAFWGRSGGRLADGQSTRFLSSRTDHRRVPAWKDAERTTQQGPQGRGAQTLAPGLTRPRFAGNQRGTRTGRPPPARALE